MLRRPSRHEQRFLGELSYPMRNLKIKTKYCFPSQEKYCLTQPTIHNKNKYKQIICYLADTFRSCRTDHLVNTDSLDKIMELA